MLNVVQFLFPISSLYSLWFILREDLMKRMVSIKNVVIALGLTLSFGVGISQNAKSAWAGYLSDPTLSMTASQGSFSFIVNPSSTSLLPSGPTVYGTATSSFGNTVPSTALILATPSYPTNSVSSPITTISDLSTLTISGTTITSTGSNLLYNSANGGFSSLNPIGSLTEYFNGNTVNTNPNTISSLGTCTAICGTVVSQVFQIQSTGSNNGDLVFTYQFSLSGITPSSNGVSGLNIAPFNSATSVGEGINVNNLVNSSTQPLPGYGVSQTGNYSPLGTNVLLGTSTPNSTENLVDTVTYSSTGGLAEQFTIGTPTGTSGSLALGSGQASPQLFVASNDIFSGLGYITLYGVNGEGAADIPVLIPGTPEPSTLVLFVTGLGLLAFISIRKKQGQPAL